MRKGFIWIMIAAMLFGIMSSGTTAYAKSKKGYITNKNFCGTFSIKGEKESVETGGYDCVIGNISKKGIVKFQLNRWSRNASRMAMSNIIKARIKGNKVKFKFKDVAQGSRGKGSLVFKKNKTIDLFVKVTAVPDFITYGLDISKTKFKKTSGKHTLYRYD